MRELAITEAEQLAGRRLDRRRKYATTDDGKPCDVSGSLVFEIFRWTRPCTGCEAPDRSHFGCRECGYHGVVHEAMWIPVYDGGSNNGI